MLEIHYTTKFKKDYKKASKQGKNLRKINRIIEGYLSLEKPLPAKYKDHSLGNNWKGYRECHVEPDWLLIYQINDDGLQLTRTGSHSELFQI